MSEYDWVIGLATAVSLALMLTVLTKPDMRIFFIWFSIFVAIMVYAQLLENWVLYLVMIIVIVVIILEFKKTTNVSVGVE